MTITSISYANFATIAAASAKPATSGNPATVAGAANSSASSATDTTQDGDGVSSYDFTDMTPNQMQSVASTLYKSGKIDAEQLLKLQLAGMPLGKRGPDGQFIPPTAADRASYANTPINYIRLAQGQVDFLQQSGLVSDPKAGYADWQNILSTLQGLQGTTSGVNITA